MRRIVLLIGVAAGWFVLESGAEAANPGDVVVNEIMQNPAAVTDANGEYFELYNVTDAEIDINGWIIKDDGSDSHTIDSGGPLTISAHGYLVLGRNEDSGTNGGYAADYDYSGFILGNDDDEIILMEGDTVIDSVAYDGGPNFPDPTGKSMELKHPGLNNNVGSNWAEATTTFGDGDCGTPGAQNSVFEAGLYVALSSFTATIEGERIALWWETGTELDILGFNIYRGEREGELRRINAVVLFATGDVTSGGEYTYTDDSVVPGETYLYRLESVHLDGGREFVGGMIEVGLPAATRVEDAVATGPGQYCLYPCSPNPFNAGTTIRFQAPDPAAVTVRIYDLQGRSVRFLAGASARDATHEIRWDGRDDDGKEVGSGMYLIRLSTGDWKAVGKLTVLR